MYILPNLSFILKNYFWICPLYPLLTQRQIELLWFSVEATTKLVNWRVIFL